jgi:hypothetical protein
MTPYDRLKELGLELMLPAVRLQTTFPSSFRVRCSTCPAKVPGSRMVRFIPER